VDRDARRSLLSIGAPRPGETWADLGCGDGGFALLLAEEIGPSGQVVAIDQDADAIRRLNAALARRPQDGGARVETRIANAAKPGALPTLDGMLLANILHACRDATALLRIAHAALGPAGRALVIEYDRADANRWVPHPIPAEALPELARGAGFAEVEVGARVPSAFGPAIYAAVARK